MPWANERGATTELVSFAQGTALLPSSRWRLSVARLVEPGPFSVIADVRRTFVPIGSGVVLSIGGERHPVAPGHAVSFDGAAGVSLVSLERPCFAVNLMVDPAAPRDVTLRLTPFPDDVEGIVAVALEATPGVGLFDVLAAGQGVAPPMACAVVVASPISG